MPRRARQARRRRQRRSDSSPERSSSSVEEEDDDDESASEGEADTEALSETSTGSGSERRHGAKRPRLMRRRRRRTAEQSEEGELLCNSDSDDSDQFSDGYDNDLLGDEEDRRRLEQMTEKEREEELFRRLERREMLKERFKIEKRLRRAKKLQNERRPSAAAADSCSDGGHPASPLFDAEAEVPTRTRAVVDSDSDDRKSASRQKKRNRSLHIKSLKAKREEKLAAKAGQSDVARRAAEDVFVASGASSSSSSESSEFEEAPKDRSPSSASEQEGSAADEGPVVQTRHDLAAIRLSRHKISKLVHAPFFKETVVGCFVRIGIGSNDGVAVYRVAEIVDVVETTKVYQLEATKTNKGARLRHGNQERVYRFEYVSNQDFTDSEFEKWMNTMGALKLKLPSMKFVQSKTEAISNAINHGFSEKEVEQIIAEKKRFKLIKTSFAIRKAEILRDIESAEYNNDMAEVERLKAALSELDDEASDAEERMYARRHEVAKINERNRNYNMFFIDSKTDQNVGISVKKEADDPFTRITTRPKIYSKPPRTKQEKEEEELEQNVASQQATPPQSSSTSTVRKATWNLTLEDQELFDMHNIETDGCLRAVMAAAKKGSSDAKLMATRHAIGEDVFRRRADDRLGARAGHR